MNNPVAVFSSAGPYLTGLSICAEKVTTMALKPAASELALIKTQGCRNVYYRFGYSLLISGLGI